jgi:hypothetical protein
LDASAVATSLGHDESVVFVIMWRDIEVVQSTILTVVIKWILALWSRCCIRWFEETATQRRYYLDEVLVVSNIGI